MYYIAAVFTTGHTYSSPAVVCPEELGVKCVLLYSPKPAIFSIFYEIPEVFESVGQKSWTAQYWLLNGVTHQGEKGPSAAALRWQRTLRRRVAGAPPGGGPGVRAF